MKKITTFIVLFLASIAVWAQGPNGTGTYYQSANGKSGQELKTALYNIIKDPDVDTYDQLWTDYKYTDKREDGFLWDMYSNITNYVIGGDKQGATISTEGSSYNREHSLPKSWFNSEAPMYSDIMHVVPVDGRTNSTRNNFPYGPNNADKNASANNFSKLGTCTLSGYAKTVFEPNDEYKGDFARIYFYMATCYEEGIVNWTSVSNGVDEVFTNNKYIPYDSWMMNMLMEWAKNDAISQKEIERNNVVYKIQGNRNPFIDFPGLENYIWGDKKDVAIAYDNFEGATYGGEITVHPEEPYNPENDAPATGEQTYKKIEWAGDLETGARYLLVFDDGAGTSMAIGTATKIGTNNVRSNAAVTIADEMFTTTTGDTDKPYELILGGKRGEYTLYDPKAKNYVSLNSEANQLHTSTTADSDNAKWTFKFEKGSVSVKNKAFPRYIYYNKSNPRFACYTGKSQYVAGIQLYKNTTTTPTSIKPVFTATSTNGRYYVYTIQGIMIRATDNYSDAIQQLPRGIYIVNGKKFVVK